MSLQSLPSNRQRCFKRIILGSVAALQKNRQPFDVDQPAIDDCCAMVDLAPMIRVANDFRQHNTSNDPLATPSAAALQH